MVTISQKKLVLCGGLVFLGFLALVVMAVGGFAAWLYNADLKPLIERQASNGLQRRVTVGAFKIGWSDPLVIEFSDLRVANASWGSVPEMVSIGHLSARIDVRALLRGVLRYESLHIEDASVVLERNPAGLGNWKFAGGGLGGPLAVLPKDRTQFPTLVDFTLDRGLVTYRTSSGKIILRIAMDRVLSQTASDETPITVRVDGAYNDVAATVDARMQSAAVLRSRGTPYGAKINIAGDGATTATFDGTMMDPLDFDGVRGPLTLAAPTLDTLLTLFGVNGAADLPLDIAGDLKRERDDWSLSTVSGKLAKTAFAGSFALHENGRGKADDISADLDSKALNIDAIARRLGYGKSAGDVASAPLQMDMTGVNLAAKLSVDQVTLAATRFAAVQLEGRLAAGDISMRSLAFSLAGGTFNAAGSLNQIEQGGRLRLTAFLSAAEANALAKLLGAGGGEIRGRLDGGATLDITGKTLGAALKTGRGAAIATMNNGDVSRDLIEKASADLRNLFRNGEGRVPVNCLLVAATLKNGLGIVSPLRLDSQEATLIGSGTVDLVGKRLDLKLQSDHDTTGFFARDIPLAVSGPFTRLAVTPMSDSDGPRLDKAESKAAVDALPTALRKLASGSPCAG
jgi:AsmA family protein